MQDGSRKSKSTQEGLDLGPAPESLGPQWRIREWFPDMSEQVERRLKSFQEELIRFNGRMNLISPRSEHESDLIHIADCVYGGQEILKATEASEIYDLGSGNGLPGLVMAILDSQRKFILIDKDARKVEFLKHVAGITGLKNVTAKQARIEDLGSDLVQCGVSRALAPLAKSLLICRKLFSGNGEYFTFKGENWVKEVADIPTQLCAFWQPRLLGEYSLPDRVSKLSVIVSRKLG